MNDKEIDDIQAAIKASQENFGKADINVKVHPIAHRDMLVLEGYNKDKANNLILKMAKEQGFSKSDIKELKENLK